ncbi:HEAT repeat domain-containing protein [Streptomyces sp. JNUCC 64]
MLIGEVARRSGVSARMLRHYESLGLVRPAERTGGGYREYSDADIERVFHIESLRSLGLSLGDVGRALDDPGFAPSKLIEDLVRRTRERIADETELLARLQRIGAAEPGDWTDVLGVVELLQVLGSASAGRRQSAALAAAGAEPVPVGTLVQSVLEESDPHVAGALRWTLARSGRAALAPLAKGLDSPSAGVRERAVRTIAELPDETATAVLREALGHSDGTVRRHAALALGARGVAEAVPTLVDMVAGEGQDVEAAEALGALAGAPGLADRIVTELVGRLGSPAGEPSARRRLAEALADVPGPAATRALAELARDGDRAVRLTATYVLGLRED